MPRCTLQTSHSFGQPRIAWSAPVEVPIKLSTREHDRLKRVVSYLHVPYQGDGNLDASQKIAALYEPYVLAFNSDKSIVFGGFEEITGSRFYQSWLVKWLD